VERMTEQLTAFEDLADPAQVEHLTEHHGHRSTPVRQMVRSARVATHEADHDDPESAGWRSDHVHADEEA
jgi:hypothetical protein